MDSVSAIENTQEMSVSVGNVLVVAGKKGDTGDSGVGIDDIFVNEAKNLIFKLTDGRQLSAGYLPAGAEGPAGIQGIPGRDGRDGKDGREIANITLTDGQLNISMSDGTVVPLGTVRGENGINGSNGVSVVGAAVQPWGNLFIFLSDGSSIDCGSVTGSSSGSGSGFVAGQISQFVKAQEFPWLACDGSLFEMSWYPDLEGSEYIENVPAGSIWYVNPLGSGTAIESEWKAQLNTLGIDAEGSINLLSPRTPSVNVIASDLSAFSQRVIAPFSDPLATLCVAGDQTSGEAISGYVTDGSKHVFMSEGFGDYGNRKVEIAVSTDLESFSSVQLVTITDDSQAALLYYDATTASFYALVGASVYSSPDALAWSLLTASATWGSYSGYRPSCIQRIGNKIAVLAGANLYIADSFAAADLEATQSRYVGVSAVDRVFVIDGKLYLTDLVKAVLFDVEQLLNISVISLPQAFTSAKQVGQSVLLANDAGDVFKTSNFTSYDAINLQTQQDYSANLKTLQFHPRSNGTLLITHGSNNRDIKLMSVAFNETEKWKLPAIPDASGAKSYIKVQ
ncbi:hypothetical protein [Pseudomonas monteilii]|uniref:hypothetical protein n=1 Tax=Pseudomonas monteilii TaxID=76759 RepID=UPI001F395C3D|nr:hypothetical protein [Pseudomonas monteilii]